VDRKLPVHVSIILTLLSIAAPKVALSQSVELRKAEPVELPGGADCNSPAHWKDGKMVVFNSMGLPVRSEGSDQFHLGHARAVFFDHYQLRTRWIESTWIDDDGTLYAWYHHEPGNVCGGKLTAPKIGALRSKDNGGSFQDLGVVLEAPTEPDCSAKNGYFAGGNGDFSVILDHHRKYFYFFFGAYAGDVSLQGVGVARMAFEDRDAPVGRVWKYYNGDWREAGLGGRLTPTYPAMTNWMREDADAFWGPSIHWNTYLEKYVILLNRTCCTPGWPQEGIYVSFNEKLEDPAGWSAPKKIMAGGQKGFAGTWWYPQVMGLDAAAQETDKTAGKVARFYLAGRSEQEIVFSKETR
jgi:hypothetical protein